MKRFVLITAVLGALVATTCGGRASEGIRRRGRERDALGDDAVERPDADAHVRRPDVRGHDRPLVGDGDEHDGRPQRRRRAPPQERLQRDEEARLDRRPAQIGASDGRTHAWVSGVNTDGKLDAWVRGNAGRGDGSLFGSLSGSFSKTGGLTDGAIGSGTGANAALIVKGLRCKQEKTPRPSVHLFVRGQIDVLSATSISVKPKDGSASQACAVKDDDDVDRVKLGDQVEMTCSQVSGAWVLTKVRKR